MGKISLVFEVAQNPIFFVVLGAHGLEKDISPSPKIFKVCQEDDTPTPPKSTKKGGWKTGTMTNSWEIDGNCTTSHVHQTFQCVSIASKLICFFSQSCYVVDGNQKSG